MDNDLHDPADPPPIHMGDFYAEFEYQPERPVTTTGVLEAGRLALAGDAEALAFLRRRSNSILAAAIDRTDDLVVAEFLADVLCSDR